VWLNNLVEFPNGSEGGDAMSGAKMTLGDLINDALQGDLIRDALQMDYSMDSSIPLNDNLSFGVYQNKPELSYANGDNGYYLNPASAGYSSDMGKSGVEVDFLNKLLEYYNNDFSVGAGKDKLFFGYNKKF